MFYLIKICCEARGRTNFQITDYYATKHIVCKIWNIILILDIFKTFINQLIICIWVYTVRRNSFCKSS